MAAATSVGAKIRLDAEDRPPASYYGAEEDASPPPTPAHSVSPLKESRGKLDKSEWWKAAEFVPRAAAPVVAQPQPSVSPPFPAYSPMLLPPGGFAPLPPHVLPFPHLRPGMLPPSLLPHLQQRLMPPHFGRLPIRLNPLLGPRPFLPPGYTANVTSISAGHGHQIPAIVLKKKRKKRNRKARKDPNGLEKEEEKGLQSPEDPKMGSQGELLEDDEEESCSSVGGGLGRRRSETDLRGLGEESGAGRTDSYDLLQSALEQGTLTMLHGSCPDLSEAQRGLLDELLWDMEEDATEPPPIQNGDHENPFDRRPPYDCGEASDTDTEVVMQRMQRSLQGTSHLAPLTVVDPDSDYELSSLPVFTAMQDAAADGRIRSEAVKALDRVVRAEMRADNRLTRSIHSDGEEEREDALFDRLAWEKDRRSAEREPDGRGAKSLMEEMEEKQLLWGERAPVQMAAVHRGPGPARSVPLREEHPLTEKFTRKTPGELFGADPMRITVNAFEDPEELVIDEVAQGRPASSRLERLRSALKSRLSASGYRPHHTQTLLEENGEYRANGFAPNYALRGPNDAVCCSVM